MSGLLISQPTIGVIGQSTGNAGTVSVVGNGTATDGAFMQFHRPGMYASYFGLDTDNAWKVGGWSAGAVSYRLFHENYFPSSAVTKALGYTPVQAGTGIEQNLANIIKIGWTTGGRLKATVDVTDIGNFALEGTANSFTGNQTITTSGATETLSLVDRGSSGVGIALRGNGASTPNKYIRAQAGNLEIVNNAYTAIVATISDGGNLNLAGDQLTMNQVAEGNLVLGNSGGYFFGNTTQAGWYKANSGYVRWDAATGDFTTTGKIIATSEVQSININAFRSVYGNYGAFIRNDGTNAYLLQTASADAYGGFNGNRPFSWNFASGNVSIADNGSATAIGGGLTVLGLIGVSVTTGVLGQVAGNTAKLEVRGGGTGNAAFMQFHRPNEYASYFGLDTDNKWKVGGWSAGAVSYELHHDGNAIKGGSGSFAIGASAQVGTLLVNGQMIVDTTSSNLTHRIQNTGANGVQINLMGSGTTTPGKTIRAINGVLDIVNNAYTASILTLEDTGNVTIAGNLAVIGLGSGLRVKEGTNAKQGVAILVGGTVTVANTSVTTYSRIFLTGQQDGGTPGYLRVSARIAGTSFTISSSTAADASVVAYQIFEPA